MHLGCADVAGTQPGCGQGCRDRCVTGVPAGRERGEYRLENGRRLGQQKPGTSLREHVRGEIPVTSLRSVPQRFGGIAVAGLASGRAPPAQGALRPEVWAEAGPENVPPERVV